MRLSRSTSAARAVQMKHSSGFGGGGLAIYASRQGAQSWSIWSLAARRASSVSWGWSRRWLNHPQLTLEARLRRAFARALSYAWAEESAHAVLDCARRRAPRQFRATGQPRQAPRAGRVARQSHRRRRV